jgi:hypothetical protein
VGDDEFDVGDVTGDVLLKGGKRKMKLIFSQNHARRDTIPEWAGHF